MSQEQIIAAIQTCARQLGRVPTRVELKQITGVSYPNVRYGFGNMAPGRCLSANYHHAERGSRCSFECD